MIAYVANDNVIHFEGGSTINLSTGQPSYLNAAATVQFRVQTQAYVDVPGQSWPAVMTWISGSDGHFIGVLRAAVELEDDTEYRFIATVDNGVDQDALYDIPLHARHRS